jgi:hypothetical protein
MVGFGPVKGNGQDGLGAWSRRRLQVWLIWPLVDTLPLVAVAPSQALVPAHPAICGPQGLLPRVAHQQAPEGRTQAVFRGPHAPALRLYCAGPRRCAPLGSSKRAARAHACRRSSRRPTEVCCM